MKVVAIIQARMGSTRLPGKVLFALGADTVLGQVIRRVRCAPEVGEVLIATTDSSKDDVVVEEALRQGAPVFRGSESDVLSRYHLAARSVNADVVVRVTADCPLFDGSILSSMLSMFLEWNAREITVDYLSNSLHRSFPRGLDAEVFTFSTLERAAAEATADYEREHVTPYIYRNPELFRIKEFRNDKDLSAHRWTLDTAEDWSFISAIYGGLGPNGELFGTNDVLQFLARHPDLSKLNAHVEQKPPY